MSIRPDRSSRIAFGRNFGVGGCFLDSALNERSHLGINSSDYRNKWSITYSERTMAFVLQQTQFASSLPHSRLFVFRRINCSATVSNRNEFYSLVVENEFHCLSRRLSNNVNVARSRSHSIMPTVHATASWVCECVCCNRFIRWMSEHANRVTYDSRLRIESIMSKPFNESRF